jgi:ribosomal protein L7/L12
MIRAWPQPLQNFAPGGLAVPQWLQPPGTIASDCPQFRQNLDPVGLAWPQRAQFIGPPHPLEPVLHTVASQGVEVRIRSAPKIPLHLRDGHPRREAARLASCVCVRVVVRETNLTPRSAATAATGSTRSLGRTPRENQAWHRRPPGRSGSMSSCRRVGGKKIQVIRVVREITGLELAAVKTLAESAPVLIKTNVSQRTAEDITTRLEALGATVEILPAGTFHPTSSSPTQEPAPPEAPPPSSPGQLVTPPAPQLGP